MGAKHRDICEDQADELELSRAQLAVLACIASHIQKDKTNSFPGIDRICRKTKYSRRYVQRILRELEAKGVLRTTSIKGGWRYHSVYEIPGIIDGVIIPEPPGDGEGPDVAPYLPYEERSAESRLRYCQVMIAKCQRNSERKQHWADEISKLEEELGIASPVNDDQAEASSWAPMPETPRNLPAPIGNQALVPLREENKDSELQELEAAYNHICDLWAGDPLRDRFNDFYQREIDKALKAYNDALQDRGIVAIDQADQLGDPVPIDAELSEQYQTLLLILRRREAVLANMTENDKKYPQRLREAEEARSNFQLFVRKEGNHSWQHPITT